MPILQSALDRINSLTSKVAASPFAQSKGLNTSTVQVKKDPGVAARAAIADTGTPGVQQIARQQAYQSRLSDISNWGKRQTSIAQQGALAKKAKQDAVRLSAPVATSGGGRQAPQAQAPNQYANFNAPTNSAARQQIVKSALSSVGTPYSWGGGGPGVQKSMGFGSGKGVVGVDCSGLTSYAYSMVGVKLPHYSNAQTAMGVRTNIKNAQPGDIVGWGKGGHVAIYIGNGQIVEAPKPGASVRVRAIRPGENVYAVRLRLAGE